MHRRSSVAHCVSDGSRNEAGPVAPTGQGTAKPRPAATWLARKNIGNQSRCCPLRPTAFGKPISGTRLLHPATRAGSSCGMGCPYVLKLTSCQAENSEFIGRAVADYIADRLGVATEFVDDIPWQEREYLLDKGEIHAG